MVDVVGAGCSWALGRCLQILGRGLGAMGARVRYTSFVGGGWLFVDGLFVDWVVVSGHSGAVSCVMGSQLVKLDRTSEGRVLTMVYNINNDK